MLFVDKIGDGGTLLFLLLLLLILSFAEFWLECLLSGFGALFLLLLLDTSERRFGLHPYEHDCFCWCSRFIALFLLLLFLLFVVKELSLSSVTTYESLEVLHF